MPDILFSPYGLDEVIATLTRFVPALERDMRQGVKAAGEFAVKRAKERTTSDGAVASGAFLKGWKYQPDSGALSVTGTVVNTAAHARAVEFGRGARKKMPPKAVIDEWMERRGIPMELSFVIRRAIARHGTVKRKGYQGFEILEQVATQDREQVLAILDRYLGEAIDKVWRAA